VWLFEQSVPQLFREVNVDWRPFVSRRVRSPPLTIF
jgi:hypothetical protein